MKTILHSAVALALVLTLFTVRAQPVRTDINPALLYYQAFLLAPDSLPAADDAYLYSERGPSQKLPDRFGEFYSRHDNQFKLIRQAARAGVACDWGIDFTPGPATLLPHLARCKAVAQAARLRVMWGVYAGHETEAREDLLASVALARNLFSDPILISVMVQFAMEMITCNTVAENFGRFSPDSLEQLAASLANPAGRGTVASCVPAEKHWFADWLIRKVVETRKAHEATDDQALEAIHKVISESLVGSEDVRSNWWENLTRAAGNTSEGVLRVLQDIGPYEDQLATLLQLPYAEFVREAPGFDAKMKDSPNPFGSLMSAWAKARQREFRVLAYLSMVRAAVEYKLHGEAALRRISDPCGQGPFGFRRFIYQGVDRGFELSSAYNKDVNEGVLIFIETPGPAFRVSGPFVGQALPKPEAPK